MEAHMSFMSWVIVPKIRRGLAASAVVLAAGGLVLFHADAKATPMYEPPLGLGTSLPVGSNASTFAGPGMHGSFALSHSSVLPGTGRPVFADVTLSADSSSDARAHAPLAMVIVLDTSGSMSGEKISQAKSAIAHLLNDMKDDDEVAFVRYSDAAQLIQPLTRVGSVRGALIARINRLEADGGTAIPRGLAAGLDALGGEKGDRVRRVVLVSDGLDDSRPESEHLASSSFERGITISSMGIGLDFDESYMGSVARAGHGNFGFVNDAAALASFLRRELKETSATVVENARVRVSLPAGLSFVRATGADARQDGAAVELSVGSLFAGEERRVLLELSASLNEGGTAAVEGFATWQRVDGSAGAAKIPTVSLVAVNDAARVDKGRDGTVLARATSVAASERELDAAKAYAQGDKDRADSLIRQNIAELGAARALAPAPAASSLAAQSSTYERTRQAFSNAAPESTAGKFHAKAAAASNFANSTMSTF
jgi:Ca-activated chloride channel family protein